MHPPQDYLIFHPERKGYQATGEALIDGVLQAAWGGTVWTDPWRRNAQSNEDPYVWGPDWWLYSYCHASQLCRAPSKSWPTVREGSRLFFCETRAAKRGWLRVDTVFVVSDQARWIQPGVSVPARFLGLQASGAGDYWGRHLRHGVPGDPVNEGRAAHRGVYTYVANLGGASYLPLNEDGLPTSVPIDKFLRGEAAQLEKSLPSNQQTRPFKLSPSQASNINAALEAASRVRVLRLTCGKPLVSRGQRLARV